MSTILQIFVVIGVLLLMAFCGTMIFAFCFALHERRFESDEDEQNKNNSIK